MGVLIRNRHGWVNQRSPVSPGAVFRTFSSMEEYDQLTFNRRGRERHFLALLPLWFSSHQFDVTSKGEGCSSMQGTLTRFNENNCVGKITSEQGVELAVHRSSIDPNRQPLKQGQSVEFRVYYGPNGPIAEDVHRSRH